MNFHRLIVYIPVFLLASGLARGGSPKPAERMNVLLIMSDDLRTELGCYASTLAKTPNIDRLAAQGIRFDRAYCQVPLCNPSRASMLTGRHPGTTGVLGNRTWYGDAHPDFISLPKYFRQNGYVSARAGKIFHGGIDDTEAWTTGGQARFLAGVTPGKPGKKAAATPDPDDAGRGVVGKRDGLTKNQRSDRWIVLPGEGEGHGDANTVQRVIRYLREFKDQKDQPFFIGCGFYKPHSPPEAPQRFYDMWDPVKIPLPVDFAEVPTVPPGFPVGSIRPSNSDLFIGRKATPQEAREMIRAYLASTSWMDANVGRVLAELDAQGLRERTIVVFWSDHGYQLGEKGKWSKAGSLWEQGTRTPLIIYDPRVKTNGQVCPRLVQMVDLYPTLVELCGLAQPPGLEGLSLVPLLEKPDAAWDHPAFSIWSEDSRYFTGVMVREDKWRYAEYFGREAGAMLIDTENDSHELTNLVTDTRYAEVVTRLSSLVQAYAKGHLPPEPKK